MKTKTIKKETKNLVLNLRKIRDEINVDIEDMSLADLMKYFKSKKTLRTDSNWKVGEKS